MSASITSVACRSTRLDGDGCTGARSEHHQSHDGGAADDFLAAFNLYVRIEFFHGLHELRRGARVQSFLVADLKRAVIGAGLDIDQCSKRFRSSLQQSFAGKNSAGDGDVLAPGILGGGHGFGEREFVANFRKLHQHGKIDACQHLDLGPAHH